MRERLAISIIAIAAASLAAAGPTIYQGINDDYVKFECGSYDMLSNPGTSSITDQGDGTLLTANHGDSSSLVTYKINFRIPGDYYLYFELEEPGATSDSVYVNHVTGFNTIPDTSGDWNNLDGTPGTPAWNGLFAIGGDGVQKDHFYGLSGSPPFTWTVASTGTVTFSVRNREAGLVWHKFAFTASTNTSAAALDAMFLSPFADIPAPPTNVVATAVGTTVELTWDSVSNAVSYDAFRSMTGSNGVYTQMTNITAPAWTNTALPTGQTYWYTIQTVDGDGSNSRDSEKVWATTAGEDLTPPAAPANFTISGEGQDWIAMSWDANVEPDLDHYTVYRSTDGIDFSWTTNVTATNWTDTGIPAVMHYYYVTAIDTNSNESSSSDTNSALPDVVPPPEPVLSSAGGENLIDMSWTMSSEEDVDRYVVYSSRLADGGFGVIATNSVGVKTYVDRWLSADGTAYYHYVVAYDLAGNTSTSATVNARTTGAFYANGFKGADGALPEDWTGYGPVSLVAHELDLVDDSVAFYDNVLATTNKQWRDIEVRTKIRHFIKDRFKKGHFAEVLCRGSDITGQGSGNYYSVEWNIYTGENGGYPGKNNQGHRFTLYRRVGGSRTHIAGGTVTNAPTDGFRDVPYYVSLKAASVSGTNVHITAAVYTDENYEILAVLNGGLTLEIDHTDTNAPAVLLKGGTVGYRHDKSSNSTGLPSFDNLEVWSAAEPIAPMIIIIR
ncbi:MAG: hypothetical protein QGH15_13670 [Kiritimatiellia bacterium]|jgi:hypothetical protein|nr:hypothetical protein [Kiritimatiellia bacterium]